MILNSSSLYISQPLNVLRQFSFRKIGYWLTICHQSAKYLFLKLRVMNMLMVLETKWYPLYYLPCILEYEWDESYVKYCSTIHTTQNTTGNSSKASPPSPTTIIISHSPSYKKTCSLRTSKPF